MFWKKGLLIFWPDPLGSLGLRWNIGYHVATFVIPFNLICNKIMFWKKLNFEFLTLSPGSGDGGLVGSAGKIFATMLLHSWFLLIWYTLDHVLKKVTFDLLTRSPRVVGSALKYWLPCRHIRDSLQFDMQQEHVLKKVEFWISDPIPRVGWWKFGGVSRQNICYHDAAFVIPFNLICTWPCSEKSDFSSSCPIP